MLTMKTDSRKVRPGDTFVALKGVSSDGHDYIDAAIQAGATTVVAERGTYSVPTKIVEDTRSYLADYLYHTYQSVLEEMTIIGVTGTNGKTTTTYLLYEALNRLGRKTAYIGTIGFYLDEKIVNLPNTSPDLCELYDMILTAHDKGYDTVIMEASSQGLAYGRLLKIPFDYAVFTNLTQDHLDFHKAMENYALAKQQLFYQLKEHGTAIINIDSPYHEYFQIGHYLTYGCEQGDYAMTQLQITEFGGSFTVKDMHIRTSLLGRYNLYNVLCVTILLDLLGFPKNKIESTVPLLTPPPGRMDILSYRENTIIIDYAHTPDAMENIFKTVEELPHHKVYVVFGCTGSRDRTKRPIMMALALSHCDYVIVTSDDLHEEEFSDIVKDMLEGNHDSRYKVEPNRYEAIRYAFQLLKKKDILLILGKGHEEYMIIKNEKIPYNDRKTVEQFIQNLEKKEIKS